MTGIIVYKEELVPKVIDETKIETRRLVAERDVKTYEHDFSLTILAVHSRKGNLKWQVGKPLTVVAGPKYFGKKAVWYCSKCCKGEDANMWLTSEEIEQTKAMLENWKHPPCGGELKKLQIIPTKIQKENLLEITEAGAIREGFKATPEFSAKKMFLMYIYALYPKGKKSLEIIKSGQPLITQLKNKMWDPEVWVIRFKRRN